MKISQFEIWMADLNPRMGTEPGKVRPVVVVQTDLLNSLHPSTIICPITTNVHADATLLRVHLRKRDHGLKDDSDIMLDQLRAIDNRRLVRRLGKLDRTKIERLKANMKVILDLDS